MKWNEIMYLEAVFLHDFICAFLDFHDFKKRKMTFVSKLT
jgi:hypothetical protein